VVAARGQRLLLDIHKVRKALSDTTAFGARRSDENYTGTMDHLDPTLTDGFPQDR